MNNHMRGKVVHDYGLDELHEELSAGRVRPRSAGLQWVVGTLPNPQLEVDVDDLFREFAKERLHYGVDFPPDGVLLGFHIGY
jgi:hypothetical protein